MKNICKRGSIAIRNKWGYCICDKCKEYRRLTQKPHTKEYQKKWRDENKEKSASYSKKWINNNKEKRKEIVNNWRKRNPDKVKAMNKKGGAKWAKNNKGKRNAIDCRRKYALMQRTPKWANLKKIELFYIEAERLTKETGIKHEVDHIAPLQGKNSSGLHVDYNLQILTRSQNRSKGNKEVSCVCS